ncbi:MAG TPA: DUF1552 domain-containing protein [Polyangia bacterium]
MRYLRRNALNRRTFLRGVGGVGVALPFLEAMLGRKAYAQTAPKRFVVCFAGMSLGRDNTGKLTDIVPDGSGANFTLKPPMMPLMPLKDDITIVSGLRIPIDGPGGRLAGFHKSSISALLSGTRPVDIGPNCNGATSDQIVANDAAFKGKTKFGSLSYRVQADAYRGGGNVGVISWRDKGSKNDPTVSPGLAFDNLFAGFVPPATGGGTAPAPMVDPVAERLRREDASVLDLGRGNAERLQTRLGSADKARLARHFEEIRALEMRLGAIPGEVKPPVTGGGTMASGCSKSTKPGPDPTVSIVEAEGSGEAGYAGEEERAQVLTGLLAKAFACDLTRVATMQYTCVQCFMNVEKLVGVKMDLHELAHLSTIQGGADVAQQKVMQMYGWHMKHFAALATQLKQEIGPDGKPLLDNTVLVFVNEGGLGPAEGKNPASHSTDNMMVVIAGGKNLGIKTGRHIVAQNQHPAQVITAAMNAVGVGAAGLGEVSGRFDPLFTA